MCDCECHQRCVNLREFQLRGYLQEVNRQFFHPLGMALALVERPNPEDDELRVFDSRTDPEGYIYDPKFLASEAANFRMRAAVVAQEREAKATVRQASFGWVVQPIPVEEAQPEAKSEPPIAPTPTPQGG